MQRNKERNNAQFEILKEKYPLEKQDFYRYLRMRYYVNVKVKDVTESSCFIEVFRKAYNSNTFGTVI